MGDGGGHLYHSHPCSGDWSHLRAGIPSFFWFHQNGCLPIKDSSCIVMLPRWLNLVAQDALMI